jgi:hypothetical protein
MRRFALLLLLPALGCYAPSISDGQLTCRADPACPVGFFCQCGVCRRNGTPMMACPMDDLGAMDLAGVDQGRHLDGCSNGGRAPQDPNLPNVALCPAAFTVRGLTTPAGRATPCNRMPEPNGMKGSTACSAEDNCTPGWRVCDGEADLTARGFTATMCEQLSAAPGFWATLQRGGPPGGVAGPPSCAEPAERLIFGCGGQGMVPNTSTCMVLRRALLDSPTAGDECSSTTMGAWLCTGTDMTNGEITVVVKPSIMGGGLFCCRN